MLLMIRLFKVQNFPTCVLTLILFIYSVAVPGWDNPTRRYPHSFRGTLPYFPQLPL